MIKHAKDVSAPGLYWCHGIPWLGVHDWTIIEVDSDGGIEVLGTEVPYRLADLDPQAELVGPLSPPTLP